MSVNIERFRQDLTYSTTASIAVVEADLRGIAKIDKASEEKQRHYEERIRRVWEIMKIFSGPIIVAGIGSFLMAFLFQNIIGGLLFALCISSVILGALGSNYYAYRMLRIATEDISLNMSVGGRRIRYEILQKILKLWKQDMKESRKIKLSLLLSKPDEKSKFVRQGTHSRHPNRQIDFYRDDWLKVKGSFADGTNFLLQISENHQVCTWKNQNNNFRRRDKYKGFEISLIFKCREDIYQALPTLEADAREAVKLPETAILKRLEIAPSRMVIKVKVPHEGKIQGPMALFDAHPTIDMMIKMEFSNYKNEGKTQAEFQVPTELLYQTIAMMHLSAYQILNLARILTQQQSA